MPSTTPPAVALIAPEPQQGGDVPPLESLAGPATTALGKPGPTAHASHAPSGKAAPAASAPPPAVASAVASAPAPPPPPSPVPVATPSAAPAAAPDPDWDPDRAYVEIGLINAQGVRERAVRAALRGVGFVGCYRRALRTNGARAVGTATLDLSIDEKGATRSAVVGGAEFLPGLTRCLQGAASGTSVPSSQVDSGGGTAEVTLAFRSP